MYIMESEDNVKKKPSLEAALAMRQVHSCFYVLIMFMTSIRAFVKRNCCSCKYSMSNVNRSVLATTKPNTV